MPLLINDYPDRYDSLIPIPQVYAYIIETNYNWALETAKIVWGLYRSPGAAERGDPPIETRTLTISKTGREAILDGEVVVREAIPSFADLKMNNLAAFVAVANAMDALHTHVPSLKDATLVPIEIPEPE